ncbi:MAG: DUF1328 family protein [Longimicrobiaceae bacterium]
MMGILFTLALLALVLSLLGFTGLSPALREVAWWLLIGFVVLMVVTFLV